MLIFALCGAAHADDALEQWRGKAISIRRLAENDVARAYAEAERLQAELPADATPADRVRLLNLLARIENYQGETEISAAHARQAFDLAKQHEDKAGQAEADITIALNAVNQGNIDAMVAADTHSLTILDGVDRPDLLAEAMLRGSMMYNRLEMLEESVAIAVQAMEIARRGNDDWVLAYAYQGMAVAYDLNGRHAEARDNYAGMLKHAKAAHSKILEGSALNGMGGMLDALGDYQGGERLIRSAVALDRSVGGPFYLARSLFLLAENQRQQGRFDKALPFLDEAVAIYRQRANKIGLWWSLFKRSEIYQDSGKLTQADADAQQAYRLAKEINFPIYLSKSARRLSAIFASQRDYRQAYQFGKEADELSAKAAGDKAGKRMLELAKRYESESKQREIDKLNRSNRHQAAELAHRALEQRWLWTVLGGSVIILAGTGFFVLRLKRSHRRLAKLNTEVLQAKNKLQATLDTIPDLMFEVGLDGRYYDCHSPHSDLLAAPAEHLLGRTVAEVMSADAAAVCLAALHEAHEKSISFGKQLSLSLPHGDFWFELSVAAKPAVAGEEPKFIVMSRNITERKQMEEALLISRQVLTEAQRIAHIGSWELDLETNALIWSDEIFRIFGIDQEQFGASYQSFIEIIHPDDREVVNQVYVDSVKNREPYEIEHRLLMADGRIKYVLERCETDYADDGKPQRSLGTVQDITERKHMEAQTLQREQEFRVLVEHSPDLIFRYDKDCRRIYTNPAVARLVGERADALLNKSPSEAKILSASEADKLMQMIRQVLLTSQPAESEVECMGVDGQLHYFHNRYAPEFNAHGDVVGVISIARDITERKRAEEALVAREREFRTLADNLPGNVVRYDNQGHRIYCNANMSKMVGTAFSHWIGQSVEDMPPMVHTISIDPYKTKLQHVLASGESGELEVVVTQTSGDIQIHNIRFMAERDADGRIIGALAIGHDITEGKRAEEALAAREREFRTLAESLPDNILRYDREGRLVYVNQVLEKTLAATAASMLGTKVRELFPHGEYDDYAQLLDSVLADGESGEIERIVLSPDSNSQAIHNIRIVAERGDNGEVIGALAIGRDVTERKLAEDALRDSEEKYRTLVEKIQAAVIVHDADTQILVSNPVAQEILGLTADQLHGKTAIDPAWHFHHEDGRLLKQEEYPVNQVLASGNALKNCVLGVHCPERQEKVWALVNADPVFGNDGAIIQVIVTFIDITQRKRAERELVLLNRAMDTSSDAAFLMDEQGRLIYVNDTACRSLGYSREELNGMSPLDIDPNMTPEIYRMLLDQAFSIGSQGAIESRHRSRDGRIFPVELAVSAIELDGAKFCLTMARDITERNAYMQDLQRWRHIFEYAEWGVLVGSAVSGELELMNPAFARMHGYSVEELTGQPISSILAPEFRESIAEQVDLGHQTGHHAFETWHIRKDGSVFPVFIDMTTVFEEDGQTLHCIVNAQDITERKRAEHDIALMSEALGKVHEAAYIMDDDARFLYINDESCRALGYSRDELLTLSVMDIGPGWTVEMVREIWQRQRETKNAESFEAHHRRKDGSTFPVEINANQFEYDGKMYGLALVRDITERKLAENEIRTLNASLEQRVLERTEELRRQTHYLRTLIDTLPMLAWLKDKDSRFLVVNQALATTCSQCVDDLVGKSDLDFWPREHAEAYRADDAEVMATGRRKTVEEPFVDAHDGVIWIETFKAPILDEDGSVLGTVGIARDISDRRAMEQARESALAEAERLAKLRSEFMARMSHELRTPLNGIMGYAQILLGENRDNERQSGMLNVIQQSGEYLLNLINDILDFAKIEAGKQELSLSDIQLPRFLSNLASIVTIRAEQKGLVFVCDIAADVPAGIRADETRLRQVLLNLLSNAVKYSVQGQVSLRVTVLEPGRLRFEVQDNGHGIEVGQLEAIFQAFEQAGDWQHRTGGTGLGLPISRELIRMMGSDIHVVSRVGEGSTFWFDLDVSMVEVCGETILDKQHVTGYQGLRRRVLVVDDVNENRALLIDLLSRLGFETFAAANGRECLDSVKAQLPDLVLLDMVMPEMDGLEAARRLRCLPEFGQTPIIAVSASASDTDVAEAVKAGVNDFQAKPIDIKRLMAQIAVLLKLDWIYAAAETKAPPQHLLNEPLVVPPLEEMNILHRLAKEGSMRDIIRQAGHLEELDRCYGPFAEKLRGLAQGYQSKAILDLVERYINRS